MYGDLLTERPRAEPFGRIYFETFRGNLEGSARIDIHKADDYKDKIIWKIFPDRLHLVLMVSAFH